MIKRFIFFLVTSITLFSCCTAKTPSLSAPDNNSPKTLIYKDALRKRHEMIIDSTVPANPYLKKCFKHKKQKAYYIGDSRYSARLGCDISRHDGVLDWEKMRAWGLDFVILRIGYMGYQSGKIILDERFRENYSAAREAGFDIGVYFFSQAINADEANAEADFVLKELASRPLELPVVYDPESITWSDWARTDGEGRDTFTLTTKTFCDRVKAAGYTPMVYSNMIWEDEMLDMSVISDYKVWYADYEKYPQSPYNFEFWQYTCFGVVPGAVTQKMDLDLWLIKAQE